MIIHRLQQTRSRGSQSPIYHLRYCYIITISNPYIFRRLFNQTCYFRALSPDILPEISNIRNIGIIAHIDAGKTTTTERMLYYSGYTRRLGNVDEGSTVTDFLPAERARGITIQSAAISFHWPPKDVGDRSQSKKGERFGANSLLRSSLPHHINLIDTPGHADFTFEVRRSLRVLDGVICILDGVAGVEAQTEEVWNQAGEWNIPRIVYVNKLDRDGAAFGRAVREIGARLRGWPAVCQIPWWTDGKGSLIGIGDVVNLRGLRYEPMGDGRLVQYFTLGQLEILHPYLAAELKQARVALVELLSEHDENMVEAFLEVNEDHLSVPPIRILDSLRHCISPGQNVIIPVLGGSSFRNVGVQPLLDMVIDVLPSPNERPDPEIRIGEFSTSLELLLSGKYPVSLMQKSKKKPATSVMDPRNFQGGFALAFKVVSDPRRGVLVYVRVYSGSIRRGDTIYNNNLKTSEKAMTLLQMFASQSVAVQSIEAGQIGVIAGSKHTRTGDTLVAYHSHRTAPPEPFSQFQLRPIEVPPPVFFSSVEPRSFREERDVQEKLALLLREDPSLHVHQDADTGQTLLSGMGELHLEIASDRLVNFLGANAVMGPIAIGYRETLNCESSRITRIYEKESSDSKGKAGCNAMVSPLDALQVTGNTSEKDYASFSHLQDGNLVVIETPRLNDDGSPRTSEDIPLPTHLSLDIVRAACLNGALAALGRGPKRSYAMRDTKVLLTLDPSEHCFGKESTSSALTAAARFATIAALKDANDRGGVSLMEPIMNVDITVDEASLGKVSQDISSSRGGHIISLGDNDLSDSGTELSKTRPIDIKKIYAPKDPYEPDASSYRDTSQLTANITRTIKAKVPLKEMIGYLKHLRSLSGGRGTFVMTVDQFVKMPAQRERMLLAELPGFRN